MVHYFHDYASVFSMRRRRHRHSGRLDLTGEHVLLVDDIFDSGRTLEAILSDLRDPRRGAASVRSLVLLRKAGRAEVDIAPDFVGFDIPDLFVVGYGLDYDGAWRQLPHVAALDPGDIRPGGTYPGDTAPGDDDVAG